MTIDGPSKVKMDCQECPEGYRVSYTPMAPGNYLISIKYGGPQHIVGSPFKAKVSGGLNIHSGSLWFTSKITSKTSLAVRPEAQLTLVAVTVSVPPSPQPIRLSPVSRSNCLRRTSSDSRTQSA